MAILEAKELSYKYGQTPVLDDISFEVDKGRFLAVGPGNVSEE